MCGRMNGVSMYAKVKWSMCAKTKGVLCVLM